MRQVLPPIFAGFLAAFVAYSSSFSVILQGLESVGATEGEAAFALLAISVVMGLGGIALSLTTRIPMNIAWSTPGAAFLATAGVPEGGFAGAVGAFLFAGFLTLLVGLVRPAARLVAAVPVSLTAAMLAGILFPLTLQPVRALAETPFEAGAIIATFLAVSVLRPLFAVPAATLVTVALILNADGPASPGALATAAEVAPQFVVPQFSLAATLGFGLPLFVISMASQNLPGLAILRANGFAPVPGRLFASLGALSIAAAPFGAHSVILAAMTAALCAGETAGPDRRLRWIAGVVSGLVYILFGLFAATVVSFASSAPLLIGALAGLALLGAFAASAHAAMERSEEREAAAVAFVVTASAVTFFGINAAVWGLLAGGAMLLLKRIAALSGRRRS